MTQYVRHFPLSWDCRCRRCHRRYHDRLHREIEKERNNTEGKEEIGTGSKRTRSQNGILSNSNDDAGDINNRSVNQGDDDEVNLTEEAENVDEEDAFERLINEFSFQNLRNHSLTKWENILPE